MEKMKHGIGMLCIGIGILIAGILRFYGYSWSIILMVLGVLAILKGIYCYYKK